MSSKMSSKEAVTKAEGSRRWMYFHSALQLALQRIAHKWTFDDFAQCFPLYVVQHKDAASGIFNLISLHMESHLNQVLQEIFAEYEVQQQLDVLHTMFTEAKARQANSGTPAADVWRPDLKPRQVAAATVIPILEREVARLRQTLEALEAENQELATILEETVKLRDTDEDRAIELFSKLQTVFDEWMNLDMEDIQSWTIQASEATKPLKQ